LLDMGDYAQQSKFVGRVGYIRPRNPPMTSGQLSDFTGCAGCEADV
jgi:hypothetical protein